MSYAKYTKVPADRSKAEIERLLARYGATQFISGWGEGRAMIGFKAKDRNVRFELALPDRKKFGAEEAHAQETRRRWRSLALVVKAKLEAVATGITTFEDEFMAHIVMPDGKTIAQHVRPQIHAAYASGRMVPLLVAGVIED